MEAEWDFPSESDNSEKHPLVFVLDSIRSLSNVGSVFRTADCLGLKGIFLCGFTGQPPNREIEKTALGSCESVFWMHFPEIVTCLGHLKKKGYRLVALEQSASSIPLQNFIAGAPLAVVLGNEIHGVSPEVLRLVDAIVEIPQYGIKKSLNVAVSAGMLAWEIRAAELRNA